MQHHKIFSSLYKIAVFQASRHYFVVEAEGLQKRLLAAPLGDLANQLLPQSTDDADVILSALFTDESLLLLQKCKNYHDFWHVVKRASIYGEIIFRQFPLPARAVSLALKRFDQDKHRKIDFLDQAD